MCAQCHGPRGAGHIAPAVGGEGFLRDASDALIKEMIAFGRTGSAMKPNLAGQGGTVSLPEADVNDIVAYLRSLQGHGGDGVGQARTQGDISLGREIADRTCAQCHGQAGSGDKGPGIGRPGFLTHVSDGFLEGTIANGRSGTEMKGFTPGVGGLVELTEHQIRSVVRYLRSGHDVGKLVRKTVHGTPANGKQLYKAYCSQCHGTWARAGFAPRLTNPVFLHAAADTYLQATMSLGRHGSAMRSMIRGGGGVVEMTSKEVNDVISYLRTSAESQKQNGN
jgi:cytochrome c oxidase cbb3-type subunit 3